MCGRAEFSFWPLRLARERFVSLAGAARSVAALHSLSSQQSAALEDGDETHHCAP